MWPSFRCLFPRNHQLALSLHPLEFFFPFILLSHSAASAETAVAWLASPLSPPLPVPDPDDGAASSDLARREETDRRADGSSPLPVLAFWPFWPFSLTLFLYLSAENVSPSTGATFSLEFANTTTLTRSSSPDPESRPGLALSPSVSSLRLLFHRKPVLSYCGVAPAFVRPLPGRSCGLWHFGSAPAGLRPCGRRYLPLWAGGRRLDSGG